MSDDSPSHRAPLAVRWRPRTFADVVGQRHVTAVLAALLRSRDEPQQLLFAGPSGTGKTTIARIYAAALLCDQGPHLGDACGQCDSCVAVLDTHNHPDVVEFDAASHGGKEEVARIAAAARNSPLWGRWKVYVIDEAHGLSRAGGEAFLKLLEEPPPHVVFALATTDAEKMLSTNRSRCLSFELLVPARTDMAANLHRVADGEGWQLDSDVAEAVIDATDDRLGVRGTVTTLAKLAPLLSRGPLTPGEAADTLGVPSATAADRVWEAIVAGDRSESLAALHRLAGCPDGVVRSMLIRRAREALVVAAATDAELSAVTWRLRSLLGAPPGRLHTELGVVLAAAPASDPTDPAALLAAAAAANAAAERLLAATTASQRHSCQHAGEADTEIPAADDDEPAATAPPDGPAGESPADTATAPTWLKAGWAAPTTPPAPTTPTAGEHLTPKTQRSPKKPTAHSKHPPASQKPAAVAHPLGEPERGAFLEAVAAQSKVARQMLELCALTVRHDEAALHIAVPSELIERARNPTFVQIVSKATNRPVRWETHR